MRINHNIAALNTYRQLSANSANGAKSLEKLSSGLRINKAGDDAAGLAISEKMRGQIRGLDQASRNAQDGISLIQTAEGALNETHSILQRMRELAVQASNDVNTESDRSVIQKEISQLNSEVDRISSTTEFNTQKLLNGSLGSTGTSSDATKVAVVSTSGLKAVVNGVANSGQYDVKITTEALQATKTAATAQDDGVIAAATGKDLIINGVKIDTSAVTDYVSLKTAVNNASAQTGVSLTSASGAALELTSTKYGASQTISLAGSDGLWLANKAFGDVSGVEPVTSDGVDAVVDITDKANSTTTTITGVGQTVLYGNAEFTAKGALNETATITVATAGASIQIGANKDQTMLVDVNEMSTKTLGDITGATKHYIKDINVTTTTGAEQAITTVDEAIKQVSAERSKLGASQNRLEHTINNLGTTSENLTASESRVRDVDMAKEMMEFTKNNILSQAAQAMLAQANQAPQGVLQLLR